MTLQLYHLSKFFCSTKWSREKFLTIPEGDREFVYGSLAGYTKGVPPTLLQSRYKTAVQALEKLDVLFARKAAAKKPPFLVGDKITVADVTAMSGLAKGYEGLYDQ